MAERDKPLGLSNIKDSYQFNCREKRDLPACGLRGWRCMPMQVLRSGFLTPASSASWRLFPRSDTCPSEQLALEPAITVPKPSLSMSDL